MKAEWLEKAAIQQPTPFGLWSLWDMQRFYAHKFIYTLTLLDQITTFAEEKCSVEIDQNSEAVASFHQEVDELLDHLKVLGLRISYKVLEEAKKYIIANSVFNEVVVRGFRQTRSTIQHELEDVLVFCVKNENAEYWEQANPLFGLEIDNAFPSSSFDIKEAGKCFAVGRATACVMHLMRAMEKPLQVMASDLGVSLKRDNWGNALIQIETAIAALNIKTDADKKEFHSAAAVQFRFFKDAWRDSSMHARAKYVEEEAEDILLAVKAFMRHLSKRLKE